MSLTSKVYGTLRWKKSDEYCSSKLGISVEEYREIKAKLLNSVNKLPTIPKEGKVVEFREQLDEGTAEITGLATSEPKGPDEIIKILKIDTTQWKLSSYWNKQKGDHWVVSALVSRIKHEPKDILAEAIKNFHPIPHKMQTKPVINEAYTDESVAILSVQDLHFGKEGNNDVVKDFEKAIINLVSRAYKSHNLDKIIFVFGGDLLNMDTFNGTTTSGTPVDNEIRAQNAYIDAFNAINWAVGYLASFTNHLHVVYLPGNHDRLSSFHLAHAISKCFSDDRITFDVTYSERKVTTFGNNFFGFEHGDVTKKNTPLIYATEFPKEWGSTIYRTCYTGHFHNKKTTEYITENEHNGFSIKHLPSLCKSDYWHYHNKFTGSKRQAVMEIHDKEKGRISEFNYIA